MVLIPMIGLQGAVLATAMGNATIVVLIFAMNHRFGCKTDVGIWICALLPLILLLDTPLATVSVLGIALIGISTNLILNTEEKTEVLKTVRRTLGKFFPSFD